MFPLLFQVLLLSGHSHAELKVNKLNKLLVNPADFQVKEELASGNALSVAFCQMKCLAAPDKCFAFQYNPEVENGCLLGGTTAVASVENTDGSEVEIYTPHINGNFTQSFYIGHVVTANWILFLIQSKTTWCWHWEVVLAMIPQFMTKRA